jgi:hypothetical protein
MMVNDHDQEAKVLIDLDNTLVFSDRTAREPGNGRCTAP